MLFIGFTFTRVIFEKFLGRGKPAPYYFEVSLRQHFVSGRLTTGG